MSFLPIPVSPMQKLASWSDLFIFYSLSNSLAYMEFIPNI